MAEEGPASRIVSVQATGQGRYTVEAELPSGWNVTLEWDENAGFGGPFAVTIGLDEQARTLGRGHGERRDNRRCPPSGTNRRGNTRGEKAHGRRRTVGDRRSLTCRRTGWTGWTERRLLCGFGADYMHLVELKERHPVTRLAELQGVGRETVRARVKEARKRELLAGPPGRPANKLTEKAQQILREASQEERNAQI